MTSFSDQEEREEPASQSEIVVEAEVRWFYNPFEGSWRDCEEFIGVLGDCGGIAMNLQGF